MKFSAIKEDHQPPAPYGDIPVATAKEEIRQSDPPSFDADKSNLFDGDSEIRSKDRISKENNNESLVAVSFTEYAFNLDAQRYLIYNNNNNELLFLFPQ